LHSILTLAIDNTNTYTLGGSKRGCVGEWARG